MDQELPARPWVLWSARHERWIDLRTAPIDPRQVLMLCPRRPARSPRTALNVMMAVVIGLVSGFLLGALCAL